MSANWTRHQVALRAALWPLDQSAKVSERIYLVLCKVFQAGGWANIPGFETGLPHRPGGLRWYHGTQHGVALHEDRRGNRSRWAE
jgi:hypothetical protein